jgi:hypothetical protein
MFAVSSQCHCGDKEGNRALQKKSSCVPGMFIRRWLRRVGLPMIGRRMGGRLDESREENKNKTESKTRQKKEK